MIDVTDMTLEQAGELPADEAVVRLRACECGFLYPEAVLESRPLTLEEAIAELRRAVARLAHDVAVQLHVARYFHAP
jgi:hypothetical protein